jgi:hypothetical protein
MVRIVLHQFSTDHGTFLPLTSDVGQGRKNTISFIGPEGFTYAILDDIILGCLKLGFQCVNFLKCPTVIFVTFLMLYLRPHNGLYFSTIRLELKLITLKG